MLTLASLFYRTSAPVNQKTERFVILIPAHNEAATLPLMLGPIMALRAGENAPEPDVVVIADNCTDNTATLARQAGAVVYERHNLEARGKGHALEWAMQKLPQDFPDYTACVILDADTLPDARFLKEAQAVLDRGAQVIQGRYDVMTPFANWRTFMLFISFALANHVRPLGRMRLGLSDGLRGNGMVFRREVLEKVPWQAYGLVEDIEYSNRLVENGYKVAYAPKAVVYGEAPSTGKAATSQRMRWEGGRAAQAKRDIPVMLKLALKKRSFVSFDRAFDLVIPPLVLLAFSVIAVNLVNLLLWLFIHHNWQTWNALLSLALLGGMLFYVVGGLLIARVPFKTFIMLSFVPVYLVWKLRFYLMLLVKRVPTEWVRTPRTTSPD
jgi:cellulose synthase/poly-beta-1,6-N-acetylglucosamine synthase-like glycosyltransferase